MNNKYVISNTNKKTIDDKYIQNLDNSTKKENQQKTLVSIILILIVTAIIILLVYLVDGLANNQGSFESHTSAVTLNSYTTTSTEKVYYVPTTTVQSAATHTYLPE